VGGDIFIRGSSSIARIFGIRPIIVGVVIVAFATSSPELFVSLLAVIRRSNDLAIGNLVGSSICNIGMVLGLAALARPISVKVSVLRRELPGLFVATFGFAITCLDLQISRLDGLFLLILFIGILIYCIKNSRGETETSVYSDKRRTSKALSAGLIIFGLLGLLLGAHLIVGSSIKIARYFNVSELVIGLTAVAIGTSLPELAASLIASIRGESDISVGNVIGSNMFNILAIVGVICLIRPVAVEPSVLMYGIPLLILYTIALAPILKTGLRISRLEGALLFASYCVYLYFVFK